MHFGTGHSECIGPLLVTLNVAQAAFREAPPLDQVVCGPITFVAHCDRQGIPFFGRAFVGYMPSGERLADTTLRRMVQSAARTGEDALERQLAQMLEMWAKPFGVAVIVRTPHECAGPQLLAEGGDHEVALWRGRYRSDRRLRSDFLARCSADLR